MRVTGLFAAAAAGLSLLSACATNRAATSESASAAPDSAQDSGWIADTTLALHVIETRYEPAQVWVPDTVVLGAEIPVTIVTYSGGCDRPGRTEVEYRDSVVFVRPYVKQLSFRPSPGYTPPPNELAPVCPGIGLTATQETTLQTTKAGVLKVRVVGRRERFEAGTGSITDTLVVDLQTTVAAPAEHW